MPTFTFGKATLAAATAWVAAHANIDTSNQPLLWSDEFDQDFLDTTNTWNVRTGGGGWGNGELQTYTTDAVTVDNDSENLVLKASRVNLGEDDVFFSGRIDTENKVLVKYATIQARIRIPNVVEGLWPAFWSLGFDFSSRDTFYEAGEIDIMELGQGLGLTEGVGNQRVVSAAHWENEDAYATYAGSRDFAADLSESYAVYTLQWTPDRLETYVDGTLVWEMDIDSASCTDCEEFHKPHFLLLNLAVGGGFTSGGSSSSGSSSGCGNSSGLSGENCALRSPGDITASLPASMMVDWVRVYDNGAGSTLLVNTPPPAMVAPSSSAPVVADPLPPPTSSAPASASVSAAPITPNIAMVSSSAPMSAAPIMSNSASAAPTLSAPVLAPISTNTVPGAVPAAPVTPNTAPVVSPPVQTNNNARSGSSSSSSSSSSSGKSGKGGSGKSGKSAGSSKGKGKGGGKGSSGDRAEVENSLEFNSGASRYGGSTIQRPMMLSITFYAFAQLFA